MFKITYTFYILFMGATSVQQLNFRFIYIYTINLVFSKQLYKVVKQLLNL